MKLQRTEQLDVFQLSLTLKRKTKSSPFIAILMLAQEQDGVSPISLQQNLLKPLPLKSCANLLDLLAKQGYLETNYGDEFFLTDFGEKSAVDKSFWIEEKGMYNVYITNSSIIPQDIVKIEPVLKEKGKGSILNVPSNIMQSLGQQLTIKGKEIMIEDFEEICLNKGKEGYILEIIAKDTASTLSLFDKNSKDIYQTDLEITKSELTDQLLSNSIGVTYSSNKKAVLVKFNKDNVSFLRKVKISNPLYSSISFEPIELEAIAHIPINQENAYSWYLELLYKNCSKYLFDEETFNQFTAENAKLIKAHYEIEMPTRSELIQIFLKREDAFYQIAKLETPNILTY